MVFYYFFSVIWRVFSEFHWFFKILDHSNSKHISVIRYRNFFGDFRHSLTVLSVFSMFFVFIFSIVQQFHFLKEPILEQMYFMARFFYNSSAVSFLKRTYNGANVFYWKVLLQSSTFSFRKFHTY